MDIKWKHDTQGDPLQGQEEIFFNCKVVFQGVGNHHNYAIVSCYYKPESPHMGVVMLVDLVKREVIDDIVFDVSGMRSGVDYGLSGKDMWACMELLNFFHIST